MCLRKQNYKNEFINGFIASIPIVLGYFFVSIGVGVYASQNGISAASASVMSLCNLTSAGEIAAVEIFGRAGGYLELLFSQIIINARYALMGIALSQKKFSPRFNIPKRAAAAYGITDEIFAVLFNKKDEITPVFTIPLILAPVIAWTSGTFIGVAVGSVVDEKISSSLSILIYAMLIAIIVPEASRKIPILLTVVVAGGLSSIIYYLIPALPNGYTIIISAILSAILASILFPIRIPENEDKNECENTKTLSEEEK